MQHSPSTTERPLRVGHVIAGYWPATYYGGPTLSAFRLCNALARNDCDVRVLTTNVNGPGSRLDVPRHREVDLEGVKVRYAHSVIDYPLAPGLFFWLPEMLRWADVVHVTGVYSFHVIPTLAACRALDKPMVWSLRGSLQRWRDERKLALKTGWEQVCRTLVPRRCALHVTATPEAEASSERLGVAHLEIAQIPNGVALPDPCPSPPEPVGDGVFKLLYIGRLDPIKGIENLLDGLALLKAQEVPFSLAMVGSGDEAYEQQLRDRITKLELTSEVTLLGHLVGEKKRAAFEACHAVMVPSYIENFGMVIAEALAHCRPVVASRGAPWPQLESQGCGLWVDNDAASLCEAIAALRNRPIDDMGRAGRQWMQQDYSWDGVARQMCATYQGLLAR